MSEEPRQGQESPEQGEWTAPPEEGGGRADSTRLSNLALLVAGVVFLLFSWALIRQGENTDEKISIAVNSCAALCTFGILTILYGENRVYRLFEHLFIGVATGYGVFVTWRDVLEGDWWRPMTKEGQWYWIIPPLCALLYYTIYTRKFAWMSRFVISIMFGLAAGQAFQGFAAELGPQITKSFKPLWGVPPGELLANLLFVATLFCVLSYFVFSFRHQSRTLNGASAAGRWLLMVAFGAIFGSTVMARFSLFINRVQFLFFDWLELNVRLPWLR